MCFNHFCCPVPVITLLSRVRIAMWFVWWDACGLACFLFGEITMLYCNYCTVFEVVLPWMGASSPWAWINIAAFEAILILVHWSHWMAAVTTPGHIVKEKVGCRVCGQCFPLLLLAILAIILPINGMHSMENHGLQLHCEFDCACMAFAALQGVASS